MLAEWKAPRPAEPLDEDAARKAVEKLIDHAPTLRIGYAPAPYPEAPSRWWQARRCGCPVPAEPPMRRTRNDRCRTTTFNLSQAEWRRIFGPLRVDVHPDDDRRLALDIACRASVLQRLQRVATVRGITIDWSLPLDLAHAAMHAALMDQLRAEHDGKEARRVHAGRARSRNRRGAIL